MDETLSIIHSKSIEDGKSLNKLESWLIRLTNISYNYEKLVLCDVLVFKSNFLMIKKQHDNLIILLCD